MVKSMPKYIPAAIGDQLEVFLDRIIDNTIQLELEFPRRLDVERLARAIDLILDAEPVLGCRWVARWRKPVWERLDPGERQSFLLVRSQDEYEAFKSESIDYLVGPQVKACLWRSASGDYLLLKVSHIAADAGGVKAIAGGVSSIYNRLATDPDYQPECNLAGSRGIQQILRYVPWHAYPMIYLRFLGLQFSHAAAWHSSYFLPFKDGPRENLGFACRFLPADRVSYLKDYGRSHDATLNDLALTAFIRALTLEGVRRARSRLHVSTTVDLRLWYLPSKRAGGICNLSGMEYLDLGTDAGPDFATTLQLVSINMRRRKANSLGITEMVGGLPLFHIVPLGLTKEVYLKGLERALEKNYLPQGLTNMGNIDDESVTFDEAPSKARLLPPSEYPPGFLAGVSGYAGTLTIAAGTYPFSRNVVEQFLDAMVAELAAVVS